MLAKFTQSISKQESFYVLDHLLYEGKINIELYGAMVAGLRSFDDDQELGMELVMDEPELVVMVKLFGI